MTVTPPYFPIWEDMPKKGTYWVLVYDRLGHVEGHMSYGMARGHMLDSDEVLEQRKEMASNFTSFNALKVDRPVYRLKITIKPRKR